ncbi:hypothetical protein DPMN_005564 [Dreissena polymorpha]|uniref:Uncharacterized protein n=1 Tax=Dreissena polymorpha TaxID=45954 RepID=A0A9D4RWP9_DREPO|nr:hypothetical protein DPMN_005512 [Dreissena polymorpha]KAH3881638.1 hypothetical protein DPMN_005564 [Dreissena polymorpha]
MINTRLANVDLQASKYTHCSGIADAPKHSSSAVQTGSETFSTVRSHPSQACIQHDKAISCLEPLWKRKRGPHRHPLCRDFDAEVKQMGKTCRQQESRWSAAMSQKGPQAKMR